MKAYGEYADDVYETELENGKIVTCESKVLETVSFGFNRVTVQTPLYDENGEIVMKKGKPVADKDKKDTEDIPLNQDIDSYIEYAVTPFNADAWVDKKGIKVGYTIPFTKTFYKYQELEPANVIAQRILTHEQELEESLRQLFGEGE